MNPVRDPAKVERLIEAALRMPRGTPAAGGAGTIHNFRIMAGTVWSLDMALRDLGYEYDPTNTTVSECAGGADAREKP